MRHQTAIRNGSHWLLCNIQPSLSDYVLSYAFSRSGPGTISQRLTVHISGYSLPGNDASCIS
ncbi:hypothetical protein 20Sep420_00051 [Pseudomonas phage 20Sep420]|nr:hypothetical protein 20Sep420_00051 [Pseudomonas phage 20Sep420]